MTKDNELKEKFETISELHSAYDALSYPLLFPYGKQGWSPKAISRYLKKTKHDSTNNSQTSFNKSHNSTPSSSTSNNSTKDSQQLPEFKNKTKFVTSMQYHSYMAHDRLSKLISTISTKQFESTMPKIKVFLTI
jgi:hypothetical protein